MNIKGTMMRDATPYNNLNPDLILDAIESIGFHCTGSLLALNSYENRVYQVGLEDANPVIAKFYRPARWSDNAILEEHQFALELVEHEIPVVAPCMIDSKTLHHYQNFRFTLFPKHGGRTIELDNLNHLEWMGRFIGRLHAVGAQKPFHHRPRLDVQTYGYEPYRFLIEHDFISYELKQQFCATVDTLLNKIEQRFQQIADIHYVRIHGDCHAGNVLWSDLGPHIVDLDDCLMGPRVQDIWMLLTGDTEHEVTVQRNAILKGYQEFHDIDFREFALIEALRSLRMIQYAGWLAKRWQDPAFPLNFPWFNTLGYWKELIQHLDGQILKV